MVGYRHFDTHNVEPLYPFGYGLSYTTFTMSDLTVRPLKNGGAEVRVKVKNTGSTAGAEVVQVYVHDKKPLLVRPKKELKAFSKVHLLPGEERLVTLKLGDEAFRYYDDRNGEWVRSKGGYILFAGNSSGNTPPQVLFK